MKLRLGAAVIAVALTALSTTNGAPAEAGSVDITAPEVGSCHDLTWDEAYGESEPLPAVPCTDPHTLVTTKVITFDSAPDWSSGALADRVVSQCFRSMVDLFEGQVKSLQMSTYGIWFFYPTKAQRRAGALWARCDVGIHSTVGRTSNQTIKKLPTDAAPPLGTLPLDDSLAKCRKGKRGDYVITTCDRSHDLRAAKAVLYPGSRYPGERKLNKWTNDRCGRALHRSFGYYSTPTKFNWKGKLRYSICYKTTSR